MNEQEAKRLCALRELVRETFAQALMVRTDTISDTADFFDELGGDSLDSLDVAVHLEEICGQRVPEEEYALCRCVEDAALLLLRLEQGSAPEAAPEEKKTVTPITRFEDTPEYAAFQQRLRTADETGNPYFLCNDSPLRDTSLHDGREILNFSSYNYAGMSGRPETVKAAQEAAAHYGCSASASRLLGGEKPIHKKLENAIAAWKHTEDAVVLVGGHSTNVTIVGIHYFSGTQKRKDAVIAKELAHLDEYLTMLRERYGFTAQHVEYGPGLNAECFRDDAEARDCALLDAAAEHIRAFGEKYPLTIEMGRFFAAPCGTFLTGVADAKCNLGVNYAVCDGGMHQVKYDGQLMGMQAPPLTLLRESADAAEPWMLCGSLCTTADVLVREAQLPPLRVGDVIALGRCGAYSVTEGVAVFLSRDMPRVALYRGGDFTLVRDRFATDALNTCRTPEDEA